MAKTYGINPKQKTAEQINSEYQHHTFNLGHKYSVISALEDEIAEHRTKIKELQKEINQLPKQPPEAVSPLNLEEESQDEHAVGL